MFCFPTQLASRPTEYIILMFLNVYTFSTALFSATYLTTYAHALKSYKELNSFLLLPLGRMNKSGL